MFNGPTTLDAINFPNTFLWKLHTFSDYNNSDSTHQLHCSTARSQKEKKTCLFQVSPTKCKTEDTIPFYISSSRWILIQTERHSRKNTNSTIKCSRLNDLERITVSVCHNYPCNLRFIIISIFRLQFSAKIFNCCWLFTCDTVSTLCLSFLLWLVFFFLWLLFPHIRCH